MRVAPPYAGSQCSDRELVACVGRVIEAGSKRVLAAENSSWARSDRAFPAAESRPPSMVVFGLGIDVDLRGDESPTRNRGATGLPDIA